MLWEFLTALDPRHALASALGFSIIFYAVAANVGWANRNPGFSRAGRLISWTRAAWAPRALRAILRWAYYLLLPYGALVLGYDSVRALGLWNLDWSGNAGIAIALLVGALVVFTWVWRPYARAEHPAAVESSGWGRAQHFLEIFYEQAHWAFYRSGPILWLNNLYWGSFLGLALVFIEGWSNPRARESVREITRADTPLWTGSVAIVSAIIFIFTQNFWYCLIAHLVLDFGLRPRIGFPRASASTLSLEER
ncbi:MAG: hypothetical protein HY070_05130 [Chloroflexi bacterium]|nr:hypothetical protein [Chloroflexota bacterium]